MSLWKPFICPPCWTDQTLAETVCRGAGARKPSDFLSTCGDWLYSVKAAGFQLQLVLVLVLVRS